MTDTQAPVRRIGILGGGQLGRMLSVAASRLGIACHIFEPDPKAPAAQVAAAHTAAPYDDLDALKRFAEDVDVITYEFENIPVEALEALSAMRPIRPGRRALEVSQDRLTEKSFIRGLGLRVADFAPVETLEDLEEALEAINRPAILKTRRFGYDGKGQARITPDTNAEDALVSLAGAPAILEAFVAFSCEISVIIARGADGETVAFDPGQNVHEGGILRTTTVPAEVPARLRTDAVLAASQIASALDYVGVMGVEFFVARDGLVVNEIAPRVHNSGHWTQNACAVDQFEQHIRAVAGLPLGDGQRATNVVMENLIGSDIDRVPELLSRPNAAVHLYGKAEAREGRKMGHVNHVHPLG